MQLSPFHPIMRRIAPPIYMLTEPLLNPIRRALAPYQRNSPLDFSILAAILLIEIVRRLLWRLLVG